MIKYTVVSAYYLTVVMRIYSVLLLIFFEFLLPLFVINMNIELKIYTLFFLFATQLIKTIAHRYIEIILLIKLL